jgi:uncharacterized protein (DUF1800 family)
MTEKKLSRRQLFTPISKKHPRIIRVEKLADNFQQPSPSTFDFTLAGDLKPYVGSWGIDQAAHLLRRVTFGIKKGQLTQLSALKNANDAVDLVLKPITIVPSPPLNNYNNTEGDNPLVDPVVPSGGTWVTQPSSKSSDIEFSRIESWRGWWLDRMINAGPNIQEKMTLFWHNHFSTKTTVFNARALYVHNSLFRKQALGNFKTLVKAVTIDPQMLYFLNGYVNNKYAPDENYARELQELFTVGKDSANQYQESDVVAAARVLTGWRVEEGDKAISVTHHPEAHDIDDKVFSSFYGNTVIKGNFKGEVELDALVNMIFSRPEVALYLCRKIYRFFIYYKIDATIESTIIQPLAKILRDSNYEILPVLQTLLKSEHFFDAINKGCYIKTPLDLVVGTLRNFNIAIPSTALIDQWFMQYSINYACSDMAMIIGDPPNVAGWQAFRQSPIYYRMWITADTIRARNNFTDALALDAIYSGNAMIKIDHIAFAKQFSHPEDPNLLIEDALKILSPVSFSIAKKAFLKTILLSGERNDYYWTNAWLAYLAKPTDEMNRETVRTRLEALHRYMLSLAEYQLA